MTDFYDVIYMDPPWSYYGAQDKMGAAAKFYDTMSDEDILGLDIAGRLAKSGVVFMWATSPRLDFALACIRNWGLYFRGVAFVWVKTRKDGKPIGAQGVRPSIVKPTAEFVIAASRVATGRPMALASESVPNVIMAPKREHSRKPDEARQRIEELYPEARRLEMFARQQSAGWDTEGNQTHKFSGGLEAAFVSLAEAYRHGR